MNELIPVNYESDQVTISARDLHEFLEVKTDFRKWFPRMTEYGLEESIDYTPVIFVHPQNLQETTDYQLTIDAAKEIAMIQRTEKGKMARKYFIQVEKAWNNPTQVLARALKLADTQIEQLKQQRQEDLPKIEYYNQMNRVNKGALEMKTVAHTLNIPGIGRTKLFQILRDNKVLMKDNQPYQRYIDNGYFTVETRSRPDKYGGRVAYTITLVYPRGLAYIRKIVENAKK